MYELSTYLWEEGTDSPVIAMNPCAANKENEDGRVVSPGSRRAPPADEVGYVDECE